MAKTPKKAGHCPSYIEVNTRRSGDTYFARAELGFKASCTSSAEYAARRAAAKAWSSYFGREITAHDIDLQFIREGRYAARCFPLAIKPVDKR